MEGSVLAVSAQGLPQLPELLAHWADVRPDHLALKTPEAGLTFLGLRQQTRSAQIELAALGIAAGDVVAFQLPNWVEAFVLYHAVVGMGAIALPLMPALRDHELSYMLEETQARLFITLPTWRGFDHAAMALRVCSPWTRAALMRQPQDIGALLRRHDSVNGAEVTALPPTPLRLPQGVCSIIFTSGTSGLWPPARTCSNSAGLKMLTGSEPAHGRPDGRRDTVWRSAQASIWSLVRKLRPSIDTVSAWWSRRSSSAEVSVLSPLKMPAHWLYTRFVVIRVAPRS